MKQCIKCGQELTDNALFCHTCGEKQVSENKKCSNCGTQIEWGVFCPNCGTKNEPSDFENPNDNSKTEILYEERIQSENLQNMSVNQQEINKDKKAENSGCFRGFVKLVACLLLMLGALTAIFIFFIGHETHKSYSESLAISKAKDTLKKLSNYQDMYHVAYGSTTSQFADLELKKITDKGTFASSPEECRKSKSTRFNKYACGEYYAYAIGNPKVIECDSSGIGNRVWAIAIDEDVPKYYRCMCEDNKGNIKHGDCSTFNDHMRFAELGDAEAQFFLGVRYYNGEGVSQNYSEAVKWFTKAAEQNIPEAQVNLGKMYLEGKGVKRDPQTAKKWLEKEGAQQLLKERQIENSMREYMEKYF